MKSLPVILSVLVLAIVSCKNKGQAPPEAPVTDTTAQAADSNATYLPVADLLRNDIKRIDSFAGGILRKTTRNGKQDSSFVKPADLHQAAQAFFAPELESAILRNTFKESSFMDETTNFLQFIYTPKVETTAFRNIIVYVDPIKANNNVTRVYMEKEFSTGDTAVQQKLTWNFGQYFYTITIRQVGENAPATTVDKYIWEPAAFAE